jgi:predicted Zn-dependent protease
MTSNLLSAMISAVSLWTCLDGEIETLTLKLGDKFIATALPDGTIFVGTSQLFGCFKIGHVCAILAHEMGHLIARHTAERFSHDLVLNKFAELFGFEGTMYNNLAVFRLQELEADRIGLTLMSDTGFDPQDSVDYLWGQITGSWNSLNKKIPVSKAVEEGLNDHPSVSQYRPFQKQR